MRHPFGEIVSIKPFSAGSKDAHGNPVESWGAAVDYAGCAIAPASSVEPDGEPRDSNTTTLTVYGPYELEAGYRDIAVYQGLEFEIVGEVEKWKSPFNGSTPGCFLTIRRTDG